MDNDFELKIEHRPGLVCGFFYNDLFHYNKKMIKYFLIFILWCVLSFVSFLPFNLIQLYYISGVIAIIWLIYKISSKVVDEYSVNENNNLVITRHYSKKEILTKEILANDIKGFRLYQRIKINPKTKTAVIDSCDGNFVLTFFSGNSLKLEDFFQKHYPKIVNRGNFSQIESAHKKMIISAFILFILYILFLLIMMIFFSS